MSYTLECPYCEADLGEPDDCYEPTDHEHECHECSKSFIFGVEYERTYYPRKADCLNGGAHRYKPMIGAPVEHFAGRVRCEDCGEESRLEAKADTASGRAQRTNNNEGDDADPAR
ncbi:hypothetical protein [Massilia sp. BHUDP2]|uniref:hypothetical protein n=1 Tax=Massilia sp. BHUDP2 TaxID=3034505 RepID=UPI003906BC4A